MLLIALSYSNSCDDSFLHDCLKNLANKDAAFVVFISVITCLEMCIHCDMHRCKQHSDGIFGQNPAKNGLYSLNFIN